MFNHQQRSRSTQIDWWPGILARLASLILRGDASIRRSIVPVMAVGMASRLWIDTEVDPYVPICHPFRHGRHCPQTGAADSVADFGIRRGWIDLACHHRRCEARPLADASRARAVATSLESWNTHTGDSVHLFCIMPDHAHVLLEVHDRDQLSLVKSIKLTTTNAWWKAGGQGRLWQRSFYDHGIRGPRDYDATVAYILDNPVKAGLVES
ncbi:hypothetical protein BH23CHL5_BH23CHL5_19700 [soil metagenome]